MKIIILIICLFTLQPSKINAQCNARVPDILSIFGQYHDIASSNSRIELYSNWQFITLGRTDLRDDIDFPNDGTRGRFSINGDTLTLHHERILVDLVSDSDEVIDVYGPDDPFSGRYLFFTKDDRIYLVPVSAASEFCDDSYLKKEFFVRPRVYKKMNIK